MSVILVMENTGLSYKLYKLINKLLKENILIINTFFNLTRV